MVGTLLLIGVATAANAIVVLYKVRKKRAADALVDVGVSSVMTVLFAGTLTGMATAVMASLFFSMYLWFDPIELPSVAELRTRYA